MKKIFQSEQGFSMQVLLMFTAFILILGFSTGVVFQKEVINKYQAKNVKISPTVALTQVPTFPPGKKFTTDEVKKLIVLGAQQREEGKYEEGEKNVLAAYNAAMEIQDPVLAVEAGNNLSIQYRLTAGRLHRKGETKKAFEYSQKSLNIFENLQQKGWLSDKDPINVRSWAHALLYAGSIDEAIPMLDQSYALQTSPAAKGDERCHKAAALISDGKKEEAGAFIEEGIDLIEKNNGSKVWHTFCLMTQATFHAKSGAAADAKRALTEAQIMAKENNLIVRQEEIEYLFSKEVGDIDVLTAVGTPKTQ